MSEILITAARESPSSPVSSSIAASSAGIAGAVPGRAPTLILGAEEALSKLAITK